MHYTQQSLCILITKCNIPKINSIKIILLSIDETINLDYAYLKKLAKETVGYTYYSN
jgi:hypothetical protein